MDVQIGQLNSTVHAVDGDTDAMKRTVQAVLEALRQEQSNAQSLKSDLDIRSIIEQQREPI